MATSLPQVKPKSCGNRDSTDICAGSATVGRRIRSSLCWVESDRWVTPAMLVEMLDVHGNESGDMRETESGLSSSGQTSIFALYFEH